MKKNSGITLISLVVTIVLLLILAGVGTYSGIEAINTSKYTKFKTELKIMQSYVNKWYEECAPENMFADNYDTQFTNNINEKLGVTGLAGSETALQAIGDTDYSNYYMLDTEQKSALKIDGVEQKVLVNIKKRRVVSYDGFKSPDGTMIYVLDNNGETYNVGFDKNKVEEDELKLALFEKSHNIYPSSNDFKVYELINALYGDSQIAEEQMNLLNNYLEEYHKTIIPIKTLQDLQKIGNDVNYPLDGRYLQLNDITFESSDTLTPIGSENSPFTGEYIGNFHEISNLKLNIQSAIAGMFSTNNGNIVSIKFKDYEIKTGYRIIGTVCGLNEKNGTIEKCSTVNGEVECTSEDNTATNKSGGICGINRGKISNCINESEVIGHAANIGGIVGISDYQKSIIDSCINTGNVTCCYVGNSANGSNTGGIMGALGVNCKNGVVSNCYNTGKIEGKSTAVGGIVGRQQENNSTVSKCYNIGNIKGIQYVGGIVGITRANIFQVYNLGKIGSEDINSKDIGGIVGMVIKNANLNNAYNLGNVVGDDRVGGIIGTMYYESSYCSIVRFCYNVRTSKTNRSIKFKYKKNWKYYYIL